MGRESHILDPDCRGHRLMKSGAEAERYQSGDEVLVALRPSKIRISEPGRPPEQVNQVGGVVKSLIFVGTYAQIIVHTPIHEDLVVTVPLGRGAVPPGKGDDVTLYWDAEASVLVEDDEQ